MALQQIGLSFGRKILEHPSYDGSGSDQAMDKVRAKKEPSY